MNKAVWRSHLIVICLYALSGLLVDLNGELPGMGESVSTLFHGILLGAFIYGAVIMVLLDRKKIWYAAMCLAVAVVWEFPLGYIL